MRAARNIINWGVGSLLLWSSLVFAHSGGVIPSPGKPATVMIDVTNTSSLSEWTAAGAPSFSIDNGHPNTALIYFLHKADGIYLRLEVTDGTPHNFDAIKIFFDLSHNGGSSRDADDWGIEITRDGVFKKAGPGNASSSGWPDIPAGNVGVSPLSDNPWIVELRIPSGALDATHNLDFATDHGKIGVYFQVFNAIEVLPEPPFSTTFNQWPNPMDDVLIEDDPSQWGNYEFDPTTTFPNISVTGVRRGAAAAEDWYKISHTLDNDFSVRVRNPGGTAIADAENVRLNLYLAARGIGEPWHRLDEATVLNNDCGLPNNDPMWTLLPKDQVCSGSGSLADISFKTLQDIVNNTAQYTIKNGMPMTRLGGLQLTVNAGTENWVNVLRWNTTAEQDHRFTEVEVPSGSGMIYRRQHACMKAEAIFADDPNTTDNVRQVNMDFVCVPGAMANWFYFSFGWAGFFKYDPDKGKEMFLQVDLRNMDTQAGWKYQFEGVKPVKENTFVANIQGKQSLAVKLGIFAPSPEVLGRPIKENLIIPPKSGGRHANARGASGDSPIYVKVNAGSTLWIVNYSFAESDSQFVDLDGAEGSLPFNGPAGLPSSYLQDKNNLMAPNVAFGALMGSFDNFRTAFEIAEGVQVKVPQGATYLALGINDHRGEYNNNAGTGFRVKVSLPANQASPMGILEKLKKEFVSDALAQQPDTLQIVPISEVMPILCINGYEAIGQKRTIGGKPYELYRYIGNVCWGIINVHPHDRSKEPDRGDPFEEQPPCACGSASAASLAFSSFITVLGIAIIGRRVWRKTKGNDEKKAG